MDYLTFGRYARRLGLARTARINCIEQAYDLESERFGSLS